MLLICCTPFSIVYILLQDCQLSNLLLLLFFVKSCHRVLGNCFFTLSTFSSLDRINMTQAFTNSLHEDTENMVWVERLSFFCGHILLIMLGISIIGRCLFPKPWGSGLKFCYHKKNCRGLVYGPWPFLHGIFEILSLWLWGPQIWGFIYIKRETWWIRPYLKYVTHVQKLSTFDQQPPKSTDKMGAPQFCIHSIKLDIWDVPTMGMFGDFFI